jgi:hypothetical protein
MCDMSMYVTDYDNMQHNSITWSHNKE